MKTDILDQVVGKVISAGAEEFEVESNEREATVTAFSGPDGELVASFDSESEEWRQLRAKLHAAMRNKGLTISVRQAEYHVRVTIFDSSEEDGYRVTLQRRSSYTINGR